MNTILFIFLLIHLLVCLVCFILTYLNILKNPYIDVFVALFVPVFGLVSLLLRSHVYRKTERQAKELGLPRLQIDDNVRRSILVEDSENTNEVVPLSEAFVVNDPGTQRVMMKETLYDLNCRVEIDEDDMPDKVVPIQEALLINDSHTKRELIMDVLYTNPSAYILQLSEARVNDDPEVVHYAVTALVEIQKEFDLKFQALSKELMENPDDEVLIRKYQNLLEQYLSSGLLEGSRRDAQLRKYVDVLKKRLSKNEDSLSLWIKKADADMILQNLEDLRADAEKMIAFRPENEQGYLYLLKYHAIRKDREGVMDVIRLIDQRKIYLSSDGRGEIEFWRS